VAESALFIGWGSSRTGREKAAAKLFQDTVATWEGYKTSGAIESYELVLLAAHGGDLTGFALLRGEPEKLDEIKRQPEFRRRLLMASALLEGVGVVEAFVDGGVQRGMETWREVLADLA
jgi:hypothetical protein